MPSDSAQRFTHYVHELCTDSGARADLRSGLGRTVDHAPRLHKYLATWTRHCSRHQETVRYTIAALIAHNPDEVWPDPSPGNIGASIALDDERAETTRETSIHLLVRQPASQLCRMLTRILVPLRTANTPIDFPQLLDDATWWPTHHQRTARRWLQSYYRTDYDHTHSTRSPNDHAP